MSGISLAVALPFRLTKIVVTPARVKLRRKSSLRRFLQLALEPLGDLLERVFDGGPGPGGLNHHRLDDEGRVLVAAEPEVGHDAGDHRDDHEVDDERAVLERPFRKIEPGHGSDPSRRTF